MDLTDRLVAIAGEWALANDRSTARLATIVANDGKLFDRIGNGATCTVVTYERFLAFFRDPKNWPDDRVPPAVVRLLERGLQGSGHAVQPAAAEAVAP